MAEDVNVLAKQPQERTLKIRNDGIDLHIARLERLAPAEGEEMSGDD